MFRKIKINACKNKCLAKNQTYVWNLKYFYVKYFCEHQRLGASDAFIAVEIEKAIQHKFRKDI